MKLVKTASGKKVVLSKQDWIDIGQKSGWLVEAKKKHFKHSPKEHGFIDECMDKNKDKDDPGAYCASIVDKVKGTTEWRGESKSATEPEMAKEAQRNPARPAGFTMTIDNFDNDALAGNRWRSELPRLLDRVKEDIRQNSIGGKLMDINGNSIGSWEIRMEFGR